MSQRRKMILAIAAIALAILGSGVIILRGSPGNYWMTPDELLDNAEITGDRARVGGRIVEGSLESEGTRLSFAIRAAGEKNELSVSYTGFVSAGFSDLSEVIVEGYFRDGAFYADNILVRCPENYMAEKATIGLYKAVGIEGSLYR